MVFAPYLTGVVECDSGGVSAPMSIHPSVVAAMKAAVQVSPEYMPLRLHLASLLLEASEPADALEQYSFVLAREPANLDALAGAAKAAEAAGEPTRAEGYRRLLAALGGEVTT